MDTPRRLHKSSDNKIIFGVCGGLGEYFNVDPALFRVIFLFLLLFGGGGLLLYLVMAIVMPSVEQKDAPAKDAIKQNAEQLGKDIKEGVDKMTERLQNRRDDGHLILGLILLLLGGYFLLSNFGYGLPFDIGKLWPAIIIVLGIYVLMRKR
jgi:phage shock protein C